MMSFIERKLRKVLGVKAHDPDPEKMTARERRDAAAAMIGTGKGMETRVLDEAAARAASERAHPEMVSDLVDGSEAALRAAEQASEKDGAHLRSDLVDDSERAVADVIEAQRHEPPRSDPVDNSVGALEAVRRANEPKSLTAQQEKEMKEG